MDQNILAALIREGSRVVSDIIRQVGASRSTTGPDYDKAIQESNARLAYLLDQSSPRPAVPATTPAPAPASEPKTAQVQPGKATAIATGCVPCSLGHVGTCASILSESLRFGRTEGMTSPEVVDRVNMCLDELNAMERVDLRPEMTSNLTGWERDLVNQLQVKSRLIRHGLEGLQRIEDLEKVAADVQTTRKEIGRAWFQNKLANLTPEDKAEISRRVDEKLEQITAQEGKDGTE